MVLKLIHGFLWGPGLHQDTSMSELDWTFRIRTVAAFDLLNEYTPKWLHMYE